MSLASSFGSSSAADDAVMGVDSLVTLTGDQLEPLYQIFGRLLCIVDHKAYIEQLAATTRAGYMHMYIVQLGLGREERLYTLKRNSGCSRN